MEPAVWVVFVAAVASISINQFSARRNDDGDWEITALPGVPAMSTPATDNIRQATIAQDAIARAAQNEPRPGSVTQSSDAGANNVTVDSVGVTVDGTNGQLSYVVNYNGMEVVSTAGGTDAANVEDILDRPKGTRLYERLPREDGFRGIEFYRSLGSVEAANLGLPGPGDIWVDVYTDYEGEDDTDYLAGGIWVYAPDDASSLEDYEYGAFADGNDPFEQDNLAGLTGSATFEGGATGVYADVDEGRNYFFDAGALLLPPNSVPIASWERLKDLSITSYLDDEPVPGNPQLELQSTNIGSSDSGFFTWRHRHDP